MAQHRKKTIGSHNIARYAAAKSRCSGRTDKDVYMVNWKTLPCTFIGTLLLTSAALADINLRTNPGYVFLGAVNLELDLPITERWTLGPALTADSLLEHFMVGVRLNRFRQPRTDNGWYTGLGFRYSPTQLGQGSTFYSLRVLEHYQWQWDNFNVAAGLGPDLRLIDDQWSLWVGADLSLGWRF